MLYRIVVNVIYMIFIIYVIANHVVVESVLLDCYLFGDIVQLFILICEIAFDAMDNR